MPTLTLGSGEVAMFGYGSLLCLSSFERTYGRPYLRERYVAVLPNWRRVWDSLYPNGTYYFERPAGELCYPENILYLNIRPASGCSVNGVLYVISKDDLQGFDDREDTYDRLDITSQILGLTVTGGPAYVYVGKRECVLTEFWPIERAAIRQTYLDIVEKGLTELGAEFRAAYERSTDEAPLSLIMADRRD